MTSEEIRQKAEEHCNEVMCTVCKNKTCTERKIKCREWRNRCAGYYCGAEPREKQIAELETRCNELFLQTNEQAEQIEKMKCCENCKYNSYWGNELHCNYGLKEALQEDKLVECNKMDKWEIK